MTPIKALAMLEPLVDIVEPKSVVSYHPAPVLELDILTCTKVRFRGDFAVTKSYTLTNTPIPNHHHNRRRTWPSSRSSR
jgi:hypothetical protein